jgi:hypothetical protein
VHVSYQQSDENISDVRYTVFHSGGKTEFLVNQKMGGGTWIYLGTFHFNAAKTWKMDLYGFLLKATTRVGLQRTPLGLVEEWAILPAGQNLRIRFAGRSAESQGTRRVHDTICNMLVRQIPWCII